MDRLTETVGVGARGIVRAVEIRAATARAGVLGILAAARAPAGVLLVVDLRASAVVAAPYPREDDVRVVVGGSLDAATGPLLAGVLAAAISRRPGLLVLDLRATAGIDEAGATMLGRTARALEPWGGLLVAWHPPPAVRRTLEDLGLGDLVARGDREPVRLG